MGLFAPRSKAHDGTTPAAAMVTPFSMPCGMKILNEANHMDADSRNRCAPPNFDKYWWSSVGYYSPALCPSGYVAGCLRWNSEQGPKVEVTETAAMCVPHGYVCDTRDVSFAYSYSASAPMIQVRWAETDLANFATHPLYPGANPTNTELLGQGALITQGAGIAGRQVSGFFSASGFSPSDDFFSGGFLSGSFPSETSDGSGESASESGASATGEESTGFPRYTGYLGGDQNSGGSGGLSTGAKVGIGVGCGVVALAMIGVGIFFLVWYRRRAKRARSGYPQMGPGPGPYGTGAYAAAPQPGVPEMQDDGKSELPGGFSTASPTIAGSESQGPTPVPAVYSPVDKERKYAPSPAPVSELSPSLGSDINNPYQHLGGTEGGYQEVHGQSRSPHTELPSEPRSVEVHGASRDPYTELPTNERQPTTRAPSNPSSPVQRKAVAQPPSQTTSEPDHGVSILPGAGHTLASATFSPTVVESASGGEEFAEQPSAQELDALREQHAQLERRRERLIELEKIEKEQAELQEKMRRR